MLIVGFYLIKYELNFTDRWDCSKSNVIRKSARGIGQIVDLSEPNMHSPGCAQKHPSPGPRYLRPVDTGHELT